MSKKELFGDLNNKEIVMEVLGGIACGIMLGILLIFILGVGCSPTPVPV